MFHSFIFHHKTFFAKRHLKDFIFSLVCFGKNWNLLQIFANYYIMYILCADRCCQIQAKMSTLPRVCRESGVLCVRGPAVERSEGRRIAGGEEVEVGNGQNSYRSVCVCVRVSSKRRGRRLMMDGPLPIIHPAVE